VTGPGCKVVDGPTTTNIHIVLCLHSVGCMATGIVKHSDISHEQYRMLSLDGYTKVFEAFTVSHD
jgi:hypothetical protein